MRLIGVIYYCQAVLLALLAAVFVAVGLGIDFAVVPAVCAACFGLLGWSLRRFSPTARVLAILLSLLQVPGFPLGTIIGLYCLDKLIRADHLFGGKEHPGERAAGAR